MALTCGCTVNHVVCGEVFQGAQNGLFGVGQRDADIGRAGRLRVALKVGFPGGQVADDHAAELGNRVERAPGDDLPRFRPAEAEDAARAPELAQLLDDAGRRLRVADKLNFTAPVAVHGRAGERDERGQAN